MYSVHYVCGDRECGNQHRWGFSNWTKQEKPELFPDIACNKCGTAMSAETVEPPPVSRVSYPPPHRYFDKNARFRHTVQWSGDIL